MNTHLEQSRFNMIEQQIRPWDVLDPAVLELLDKVPRENFVPPRYLGLAFADLEIPVGHGQTMLAPKLQARIVQSLDLKKSDRVLEIGTGTGFMTALMAHLAKHVLSVEIVPELTAEARRNLAAPGMDNISLETGDGARGWLNAAPFDVIALTGSVPVLPDELRQQLAGGGRLFAVIGEAPVMEAVLIRRVSEQVFRTDILFETCVPELVGAPQPERFRF
ncbi:MAG: protein-L-isoaspartate O-methyltransferase [Methylobacillus sp.]|jgi:protein-L-isoaspartate(D-aspartate) O-methyltransferase|nr:protein-L-isoaspartate O-methyltransferase [Methylobacillus sp.]